MAYLTELDDLRSHIVYPPRGMDFAPALPAEQPVEAPPEPRPLWHQEELGFALEHKPAHPRTSATNGG